MNPYLVADINQQGQQPGQPNPFSDSAPDNFIDVNGTIYFRADNGANGRELWKIDPITGNAVQFEINPGSNGASINDLTIFNNTLYFTVDRSGVDRNGLWKIGANGNPERVLPSTAILTQEGASSLLNFNGSLYFEGLQGRGLVNKIDSSGTVTALPYLPLRSDPSLNIGGGVYSLAVVGNTIFFGCLTLQENGYGTQSGLWKLNDSGTGLEPLNFGGIPEQLTNVNGTLYFVKPETIINGVSYSDRTLWKSDGTPNGTVEVKIGSFRSDPTHPYGPQVLNLMDIGGTLYYVMQGDGLPRSIWRVNATGTPEIVKTLNETSGFPTLFPSNGALYFTANTSVGGLEQLWKVSGNGTPTLINFTNPLGSPLDFHNAITVNGDLYLTAEYDASFRNRHLTLWKVDGVTGTSTLLSDIEENTYAGSNLNNPGQLTYSNGKLYFSASSYREGRELWAYDLIRNIVVGTDANESFSATNKFDNINAAGGNDTIIATVANLQSTEIFNGGTGNDTFTLSGGSPNQTLTLDLSQTNQWQNLTNSTLTNITLTNIEHITLSSFAGNAIITGNDVANTLIGTAKNDTLSGNGGNDYLSGGAGNDSLDGGTGNDNLLGGEGNDNLLGGDGLDILDGGAGNDTLSGGAGDDVLRGGAGSDILDGGAGIDLASYYYSTTAVTVDLTNAANNTGDAAGDTFVGIENLQGSLTASSTLIGDNLNNTLLSYNGDDTLIGGAGNDVLNSGAGNDSLDGGNGNDNLAGGAGNDTLNAGADNDVLTGGAGSDILNGGDGIDLASYYYSTAAVIADLNNLQTSGDAAGDTFVGIENLQGSLTAANLLTGDGNNNQFYGYNGNDTLIGGTGNDYLSAGAGNDSLDGGTGNDNLIGGEGNDNLLGGDGIDTFDGGAGNDTLSGGADNDVLRGGAGSDILDGGAGIDLASYYYSTTAVTVDLTNAANNTGDAAGDTLVGIENLQGSLTAANLLTGDGNNNYLYGYNGDDTLIGGGGNDNLSAGAGNDSLDGGTGNDYLSGGTGDDTYIVDSTGDIVGEALNSGTDTVRSSVNYTLAVNVETLNLVGAVNGTGNAIANTINGGVGNNVINGGAGNDTLSGGAGSDTFAFGGSSFMNLLTAIGVDSITDFAISEDKIQLSKASFTALGNAGSPLGASSFTTVATDAEAATATASIVYNSSNGNLFYNADGNTTGFGINGGQFANFLSLPGSIGSPALTSNNFTIVA